MKKIVYTALMAFLPASAMAYDNNAEIGYDRGSLGYEALVNGDNEKALEQLLASNVDASDPAKLINLGRVYARMGRTIEAANAFQSAMDSRRHFDLELADGSIMNSREAARRSLQQLQSRMATR